MSQENMPKPLIIGMLTSIAVGIITILTLKKGAAKRDKLAGNAPQLDLNNPGSQDDFPSAPSISEIG